MMLRPGMAGMCSSTTNKFSLRMQALHSGWPKSEEEESGPSPYGKEAARWIRVNEKHTLQSILRRPDHVIPAVPAFIVVAAATQFRDAFLSEETPIL